MNIQFPIETPSPLQDDARDILPELILVARSTAFSDGSSVEFRLPQEFSVSAAAEQLGKARFMAKSPDGRLFVTDMVNASDNLQGKIYVLGEFDVSSQRFNKKDVYLSNLRNPNSLAFYTELSGTQWIYIALTDKLIRYPYRNGDIRPSGQEQVIARFPDYGNSFLQGGWHLTRTVAIHEDKIYVSVGSSCNACEEKPEELRAMILEMNPDGSNQQVYARGLRNAVGLKWVDSRLYATEMGSDHLGDDKPSEPFFKIEKDKHYGWPYCYQDNGQVRADDSRIWSGKNIQCAAVPVAFAAFPAHSAPLGLEYFGEQGPESLRGSFLVALHGSGNVNIGTGYSLVRVAPDGTVETFMDGFLSNGKRVARPVDVLRWDSDSFFVSDDYTGKLFYIQEK